MLKYIVGGYLLHIDLVIKWVEKKLGNDSEASRLAKELSMTRQEQYSEISWAVVVWTVLRQNTEAKINKWLMENYQDVTFPESTTKSNYHGVQTVFTHWSQEERDLWNKDLPANDDITLKLPALQDDQWYLFFRYRGSYTKKAFLDLSDPASTETKKKEAFKAFLLEELEVLPSSEDEGQLHWMTLFDNTGLDVWHERGFPFPGAGRVISHAEFLARLQG